MLDARSSLVPTQALPSGGPRTPESDRGRGTEAHTTRPERRRSSRYTTRGRASVVVREASVTRLWGVELTDSSAVGLGVRSPKPVRAGAPVTVHFGGELCPGRRGVVARCVRTTDGAYLLGVNTWAEKP